MTQAPARAAVHLTVEEAELLTHALDLLIGSYGGRPDFLKPYTQQGTEKNRHARELIQRLGIVWSKAGTADILATLTEQG